VLIPNGKTVTVRNNFMARGRFLTVEVGAQLIVLPNADFDISGGQ